MAEPPTSSVGKPQSQPPSQPSHSPFERIVVIEPGTVLFHDSDSTPASYQDTEFPVSPASKAGDEDQHDEAVLIPPKDPSINEGKRTAALGTLENQNLIDLDGAGQGHNSPSGIPGAHHHQFWLKVRNQFAPLIRHRSRQPKRPLPKPPVTKPKKMSNPSIPKPGPARLPKNSGLEQWLSEAKQCHYLPESAMKQLCEMVKECLMEESNIQPVRTPVTICGDIHGQFYDLIELFRIAGGMPGETNVQKPTTVISTGDIEPPTSITNPRLRRKIRNSDSGIESASGEDDEEEERGRPRTAGQSSRGGSSAGDSAIGVNEVSGTGNQNFVFLGDFVDRGYFSLESFTLLMCLKAKYPDRITLVRGNHESRQITQVYGFYEECQQKYGNASVWKSCCQVFDFLVLAAIVDGEVLCVHGGLSPEIRTVDQIRVVARAQEIPHEGAFCDLVWSDPEDVETWAVSPRGAGWLFGDKVATEFNHVNGLKLIARAHQLVNEGYKYHFSQRSVVTVWSAPNYCYRCGNVASIMDVGEDLVPRFSIFSAVPEDQRAVPAGRRGAGEYFL